MYYCKVVNIHYCIYIIYIIYMYSVLLYVFIIHYCIFYMCDYCVPIDNVDNIEILGMILYSDFIQMILFYTEF